MEFKVQRGPLTKQPTEILILGHYEGEPLPPEGVQIDRAIGGKIQEVIASEEFSGKFLQALIVRTDHKIASPRLLLLGLGKRTEATLDRIRQCMGRAATQIRDAGLTQFATQIHGKEIPRTKTGELAQAMVEGILLGLYQFQVYKTDRQSFSKEIRECTLIEPDQKKIVEVQMGVLRGKTIGEGVCYIRDLCTSPSNVVTPSRLAEEAKKIAADHSLRVEVLDRSDMERLGMGALLGVARGTVEPPKFIVLEYDGGKKKGRPVVLVGKSVTFDSGGISLKPAENMEQMKYDMTGGATVLGTMRVAAQMKLPLSIVGILPATDNMPSGTAIHPGDVVTTLSGKTVEVINTDAEGRLCLADALAYAARYKPAALIDLATLTGACVVALGNHAMALFGNDAKLTEQIEKASEETGERVWKMPLWDVYFDQIKSDIADLKNTGGRPGGSITAALFLKQFVGETPWIHLDIAGTSWNSEKPRPYIPKGSTGTGLRLLVQYLTNLTKQQKRKGRG